MTTSPDYFISDFSRAESAEAKVEELQKKIKKLESDLVATRHTLFIERLHRPPPPLPPPPPPLLPLPPAKKRPTPPTKPAEFKTGMRVRDNQVTMYATDVYMWGSKHEIQVDYVFKARLVKKRRLDDIDIDEASKAINETYTAAQGEMNTSSFIVKHFAQDEKEKNEEN